MFEPTKSAALLDELAQLRAEQLAELLPGQSPKHAAAAGPKYYTVAQAAEILQVHPRTIGVWIEAGKLRASRISSKCVRIPADAIDQLLRETAAV